MLLLASRPLLHQKATRAPAVSTRHACQWADSKRRIQFTGVRRSWHWQWHGELAGGAHRGLPFLIPSQVFVML